MANIEFNEKRDCIHIFFLWDKILSQDLHINDTLKLFQREKNLWNNNCLEFFLGRSDQENYYEFNFALDEKWNCYKLDSYRGGLQENYEFELRERKASFKGSTCIVEYIISYSKNLKKYIEPNKLICNFAAIINDKESGEQRFWAINHPKRKPDFHLKSCFIEVKDFYNSDGE